MSANINGPPGHFATILYKISLVRISKCNRHLVLFFHCSNPRVERTRTRRVVPLLRSCCKLMLPSECGGSHGTAKVAHKIRQFFHRAREGDTLWLALRIQCVQSDQISRLVILLQVTGFHDIINTPIYTNDAWTPEGSC